MQASEESLTEKKAEGSKLEAWIHKLKLSLDVDSSLIFKIKVDPLFNYYFKKDGDIIYYDEPFYLESIKMKTQIDFKYAPQSDF